MTNRRLRVVVLALDPDGVQGKIQNLKELGFHLLVGIR